MSGIGENAYTPVMYQDLANPFMGPMNYPIGMGAGFGFGAGMAGVGQNTTYLGGTRMRARAEEDEFLSNREKDKRTDKSLFKKAMIFFAGCVALGCIAPLRKGIKNAGGFKKYMSNTWDSIKTWYKNL